jgi:hypothetical protein
MRSEGSRKFMRSPRALDLRRLNQNLIKFFRLFGMFQLFFHHSYLHKVFSQKGGAAKSDSTTSTLAQVERKFSEQSCARIVEKFVGDEKQENCVEIIVGGNNAH